VVTANKCDKLSKTAAAENLAMIRDALGLAEETPLLAFSAEKGEGRAELLSKILEQV
jgi:GTP-binding protein